MTVFVLSQDANPTKVHLRPGDIISIAPAVLGTITEVVSDENGHVWLTYVPMEGDSPSPRRIHLDGQEWRPCNDHS